MGMFEAGQRTCIRLRRTATRGQRHSFSLQARASWLKPRRRPHEFPPLPKPQRWASHQQPRAEGRDRVGMDDTAAERLVHMWTCPTQAKSGLEWDLPNNRLRIEFPPLMLCTCAGSEVCGCGVTVETFPMSRTLSHCHRISAKLAARQHRQFH
jgi:hypothetical protein